MKEQNNGAGLQSNKNVDGKQKKPTSAYRRLRRLFVRTPFRAPVVWYRHRGLAPADMFFGAYPKSGTTYARFVLFEMFSGISSGFKATNQMMGGIGEHLSAQRLLPGGGRLISTHEYYRKDYSRAIYLVRDARDVLLSEFAFLKALDFVRDDLDSFVKHFLFTKVSGYGPWHKNLASWLDSPIAKSGNLLLVRYEDLRQDPVPCFQRMAEFLGMEVSEEKVRSAVENNSIQRMREKENKEPVKVSVRGRFVRDGAVRGWVSKLTPAQIRMIEDEMGGMLLRLGYPLSSQLNLEATVEAAQVTEGAAASDMRVVI
jgi:hypothetical protein